MLALWQAQWVVGQIKKLYADLTVDLLKIKTTGDKILDVPLAKVGGKGLFVKEIEEALVSCSADIAVHSMKDVPVEFPKGLHLAAILKREESRDALVAPVGVQMGGIDGLPHGARVGTSSLRRASQLLALRPDLKILQLRGNVETRIRKLDEGQYDAIVLAAAALIRLGIQERITHLIPSDISLPAVGQGAVGIECRINDKHINALLKPLNDPETSICVRAERAFLARLQGGCQVPIAASARLNANSPDGATLTLDGLVAGVDGTRIIRGSASENIFTVGGAENIFTSGGASGNIITDGDVSGAGENSYETSIQRAEALGKNLADELLARGARAILKEIYEQG
jgi:hydroxymethylbilane synthase